MEENVPIFLSFSNIGVKINDRQILQNVSGKVHPGEMLAVMGPSGKYIVLGWVVGKPVNSYPLLKVNRIIYFSSIEMFLTDYILWSLRLLWQTEIKILAKSWVSLIRL